MEKEKNKAIEMPLLILRGMSVFPSTITHFEAGREKSLKAIEEAMEKEQMIFLTTQKEIDIEFPVEDDFYKVGTICRIKQTLKIPGNNIRVLVEGLSRAEVRKITSVEPFFKAEVIELHEDKIKNEDHIVALMEVVFDKFSQLMKDNGRDVQLIFEQIADLDDPWIFADTIASYLPLRPSIVQTLIEELDVEERLNIIYKAIIREIEKRELKIDIEKKVREDMLQSQRDYYLREQMKEIQKELGEDNDFIDDIEKYRDELSKLEIKEATKTKISKEIDKLSRMNSSSSEAVVTRNYIETLLELPWNTATTDNNDLEKSSQILEDEHYGLDKVKERIIEFLAVRQLSKEMKAPIICLVGPPGVGKTSIARSIANSMDRKFVRISLGGVRDEAEIRGHRRTYVGAIPGRIINSIKETKVNNPVFLLDEIDKMASDFRGDPASAMLEVLDPEQNKEFVDHYLEVPFDLSKVVFITTANTTSTIPAPLLDRMELIELSGYTELEKLEIAKRYLVEKQEDENGLRHGFVKFDDDIIKYIINNYTREAGVRKLERQIGQVVRKIAVQKVKNPKLRYKKVAIKDIKEYLGKEIIRNEATVGESRVGEVTGMAWTQVGGETLTIEVSVMDGTGKIELTGKLGDVMKESARTAITYIRTIASDYDIDHTFYQKKDVHVHIPEGAIPKDGPSAGIALATAILSALSEIPVKSTVAMTGEVTLRGKVLPVGGIKDKVLAAYRAGIKTIILPEVNEADYEDIPDEVKKNIEFHFASQMEEVLSIALDKKADK